MSDISEALHIFPPGSHWIHIFHCRDKETGRILHEDLCIITVELPVWQKLSKDREEAVDVITDFTKEQKLRHAYDMRENYKRIVQSYIHTGFQDGLEKGKQDGFQDGILTERRDVARKLKAAGNPLEQIIELTGLGAGEINRL